MARAALTGPGAKGPVVAPARCGPVVHSQADRNEESHVRPTLERLVRSRVSMMSAIERSPQRCARLAGALYLVIIALGLFGEVFVRGTLVVPGDAAATASGILGSPLLWRAGIAGDLLMQVLDVPVILLLYVLLRPVSESLALLATLTNLVQTAVLAVNKLSLLVPLFLLEGAGGTLTALSPQQLEALSLLAINVHGHGFGIGLVFFGVACLVRGHLILRSGFLPGSLGVLMVVAGIAYLVNSVALLLVPSFQASIFPGVLVPAFVAELALAAWLVVKGVHTGRWQQRAASRQALHVAS
ncbi:MAG TPA: DUF4386 domain-containing protein [Albitalea sp.]